MGEAIGIRILSFDPSGNFTEGKGTTGYAIAVDGYLPHKLGDINSEGFVNKHEYWLKHEDLINFVAPDVIVIESYKLFGHKAKQQTGSEIPTAQLIGYLEMIAYKKKIPVFFQDPSTKQRHADDILVKMGIVEKKGRSYYYKGEITNMHKRDALRHNLYFQKYNKGKVFK